MSTTMRILGWKAKGLRCPDHEINCRDEQGRPHGVTLIQMPNGTGKTTTLSLLRAALSGNARHFDRSEVLEYQKRASDKPNGSFELALEYNTKLLTIIMEFDFDAGRIFYRSTHGPGQRNDFEPPRELLPFMNEKFVNFYVFDGELAEALLDANETHAEEAVETLFQVHLLQDIEFKIEKYWQKMTQNRTAKDVRGYTRRRNNLAAWSRRLKKVRAEKASLEKELFDHTQALEIQHKRYHLEISKEGERAHQKQIAEQAVADSTRRVEETSKGVLDQMRNPHALSPSIAKRMLEFKSGLDRVKLPESAAREFFEELSEESECICGRPIDGEISIHIRKRAQNYLGSDDVSVLNDIKSAVIDAVGDSLEQPERDLDQNIGVLSRQIKQLNSEENTRDEIDRAAEIADPEVRRAKEYRDDLMKRVSDAESKLEKYEGKDLSVQFERIETVHLQQVYSPETLSEGVKHLEEKVAEAADTLNMLRKKNILKAIMQEAHSSASKAITEEIRDETNQLIAKLLPHNDIRIESIKGCLRLLGKRRGSVGETLSVGYAFLSTLFHRSKYHELPFVVDSPANPIDFEVRDTIGELVPKLSGQFIAFMISSERERFLSGIEKAAESKIQYVTMFRKGVSHLETAAASVSTCEQTADGFRVTGREFFNEFQLDKEEG